MPERHPQSRARREPDPLVTGPTQVTVSSRTLLGNRNSVAIEHEGALYLLRTTRAGKLILTK